MNEIHINGFRGLGSNDVGHASARDTNVFDNAMSSNSSSGLSQRHALEMRAASKEAAREIHESSLNNIKHSVVNQKNEMIMKARGKAFKSAADLTKEITF